jgi:cell division protein FtsW (lipid II flippase)
MFSDIVKTLQDWNERTSSRQKLQHAYIVTAIGLVVSAGIVGLVNYDLGQRILSGAFLAVAAFLANAVIWALLQSFVLLRLPAKKLLLASRKKSTRK